MRPWPMILLSVSTAAFAQPPSLQVAADTGCAGVVARYRAVQENDLSMGHVAKSVYSQIKREIDKAEKVCAAGQDAKAVSMIRASEARHGYPTSI